MFSKLARCPLKRRASLQLNDKLVHTYTHRSIPLNVASIRTTDEYIVHRNLKHRYLKKFSTTTFPRLEAKEKVINRRIGNSVQHQRYYSDESGNKPAQDLELPTNFANIQLLQPQFSKKVFGDIPHTTLDPELEELSKQHLKTKGLYKDGQTSSEKLVPIDFELPALQGSNIGQHFHHIGLESSEPYLSLAKQFSSSELPMKPKVWSKAVGWTQYLEDGSFQSVPYPLEPTVVFDVEVLVKVSPYPILATAASTTHWYSWTSSTLTGSNEKVTTELIPWNSEQPNVIIAHNASYDRARLQPEYKFKASHIGFLDTMSLHVAVGGLSTIQRHKWMKYRKALQQDDLEGFEESSADSHTTANFYDVSSINSLQAVAKLYCKVEIDKGLRDVFVEGSVPDVNLDFQKLMDYCAQDVQITHQVYKEVFPLFLTKCPHPVSFAGILLMGKSFLPTTTKWQEYIDKAEQLYVEVSQAVESKLEHLAEAALSHPDPKSDPWLRCLDWTSVPQKFTKPKFKKDGSYAKNGEPRPYTNQLLPDKPEWYKSCYDTKLSKVRITTRNRLAPYLLKLKWLDNPIYHSKKFGWTFYFKPGEKQTYKATTNPLQFPVDKNDPDFEDLESLLGSGWRQYQFFKIPHKDGDAHNCGNPLSKGYTQALENNTLSSEYPLAKEALRMNTLCAYWISARDRIKAQFVVWQNDNKGFGLAKSDKKGLGEGAEAKLGMILPQIATMGTVTRRAVEATWLTASNAKPNRIGSELKSLIQAPPNYKIVGADVDSEELWIAALFGDSQFLQHGATAFGWMTLQGTKKDATDMHSKTAQILGIDRNQAKVFNYGRIYGAGVTFAVQLLRQFNPSLSQQEAKLRADRLYQETKGFKERSGRYLGTKFWYGGSESFMFNKLERIATSADPRTPVLNCAIPNALLPQNVGEEYMTSRVNWTVQSSGVDYLHLLLVGMDYLIRKYRIDARFMLSVHDEVRYLVLESDRYRLALALQVANLWTRALFAHKLGFNDLPQSVAFFSQVDLDFVLRKEVYLECTTPSQSDKIPEGEALDVYQLGELTQGYRLDKVGQEKEGTLTSWWAKDLGREDPAAEVETGSTLIDESNRAQLVKFLKAQAATSTQELKLVVNGTRTKKVSLNGSCSRSKSTSASMSSPTSASAPSSASTTKTNHPTQVKCSPDTLRFKSNTLPKQGTEGCSGVIPTTTTTLDLNTGIKRENLLVEQTSFFKHSSHLAKVLVGSNNGWKSQWSRGEGSPRNFKR